MPQRYVVSEFVVVSWRGGGVQITSPVARTTLTADEAALQLLASFATPRELQSSDDAARVGEWIDAAILVDADAPEPAALQHWDRDALALHASSRDRSWRKTPGRTTAAIAPRRSEHVIALPPPSPPRADFAALLDARHSRRTWAKQPIALQTFADLLWLSARNREQADDRVSRPYPSGGAAYSLEVYPVIDDDAIESLASGVYRYLPEAHALEVQSSFFGDVQPILVAAGHTAATDTPPVTLVITSRYARQSEEYGRLAYSLVLKEVGCLFQTLYLAAEALGLAACALGGGTPPGLLAEICNTSELEAPVVGEFAIGARAG
ncbi:MAG TPA: SagB family peptide dehydrogenase [Thermoanaerobaculia bacterium]|jgi:SagB-type dehydrogenase family enzyme